MTEPTEPAKAARGPLFTPYRAVVSVVLAMAAALLWVGFTSSQDEEAPAINDARVLLVEPAPDSIALRQDRVFARVADTHTGVLVVDGVEIPEDQLDRREGLSAIGFTPGAGTETGELEPGRNCASVIFWPTDSTRAASDTYQWCWNVQ